MGTKFMKVIQFVSYWHLYSLQQEFFLFIDPVFVCVPLGVKEFWKILVVCDPQLKIQCHHLCCVLFNTNDRRQAALTLQIECKMIAQTRRSLVIYSCVVVVLSLTQDAYDLTDAYLHLIYLFGGLFYPNRLAVNSRYTFLGSTESISLKSRCYLSFNPKAETSFHRLFCMLLIH